MVYSMAISWLNSLTRAMLGKGIALEPANCYDHDWRASMPASPALLNPGVPVSVLLVTPLAEDHASLQRIFDGSNWRLCKASTCSDALAHASGCYSAIVICAKDLPDGDWKFLLGKFESLLLRPNLIVTSRLADELLWAEVLNLGGYDVLAQPFDPDEVCRVVSLAWHEHNRRTQILAEGQTTSKMNRVSAAATVNSGV